MIRRLNLAGTGAGDEAPRLLDLPIECASVRIHSDSWSPTRPAACFAVNLSRYASRLSASMSRLPRLLPGQETTTLEINPESINL
jgi:hypothetical protein